MNHKMCGACMAPIAADGCCDCDSTDISFGPLPARACTCHPDDNPPVPCAQQYASSECKAEDARVKAGGNNPKDELGDKKVPLWLCSPIAKAHWALAQFCGRIKYGAWNWRIAGVRSSIYLSAAQRHLDAYMSGERLDPVDGTHHLGNLMACAAILLDAEAAGKLIDDRPPSVGVRPAYAEVEATMARLREQYKEHAPRHYTIEDTEG